MKQTRYVRTGTKNHQIQINVRERVRSTRCSRMPKTGLSPTRWKQRLRFYAQGEYSFDRGQKPPRNSCWAKELAKIEKYPWHRAAGLDVFGRPVGCVCGYHSQQQSTTEGANTAASHLPVTRQQSMAEGVAGPPLSGSVSMTVAEGTAGPPLSTSVSMTVAEGTAGPPLSGSVSMTVAEGTTGPPPSGSVSMTVAEGTAGPPLSSSDQAAVHKIHN